METQNQVTNIADQSSISKAEISTQQKGGNNNNKAKTGMALSAVGSLIKLLPTGTVFMFQFLSPILTNSGQCTTTTGKVLTAILLVLCGFFCFFSTFTDSYTDTTNNQRRYGIVTPRGLWPPPEKPESVDLSGYKLKFEDFVHAALTLVMFAVLGLLDANTVHCFYPGFESTRKSLLQVLPSVIGVVAGGVFMVFPNTRHGIGYPPTTTDNDTCPNSNVDGGV